jgi:hypothetical protein
MNKVKYIGRNNGMKVKEKFIASAFVSPEKAVDYFYSLEELPALIAIGTMRSDLLIGKEKFDGSRYLYYHNNIHDAFGKDVLKDKSLRGEISLGIYNEFVNNPKQHAHLLSSIESLSHYLLFELADDSDFVMKTSEEKGCKVFSGSY